MRGVGTLWGGESVGFYGGFRGGESPPSRTQGPDPPIQWRKSQVRLKNSFDFKNIQWLGIISTNIDNFCV